MLWSKRGFDIVHEEFWRWSCYPFDAWRLFLSWVSFCTTKAFGSNFVANCGLPSKRSEQHIIKVWFSPNVAVVKQSSLWILAVTQTCSSIDARVALAVFQTLLITTKKILSTRNKRPASSTQKLATPKFFSAQSYERQIDNFITLVSLKKYEFYRVSQCFNWNELRFQKYVFFRKRIAVWAFFVNCEMKIAYQSNFYPIY